MLKDLTVYVCVREREKERVCTSICSSELLWHQLGGGREDPGHSDLAEQKYNVGLEEQYRIEGSVCVSLCFILAPLHASQVNYYQRLVVLLGS